MAIPRISLTDIDGSLVSVKQATVICGMSDSNVRYHMGRRGVTSIKKLLEIQKTIRENGHDAFVKARLYKCKHGDMTLSQMHATHEYKSTVSLTTFGARVQCHGPESYKIWLPVQHSKPDKKKKVCVSCGHIRGSSEFPAWPRGNCRSCNPSVNVKKQIKQRCNGKVKPGGHVMSGGKLYSVSECHAKKGCKGKVAAFRIMENGQVLKNTTINLGSDWQRVSP